MTAPPSVLIVPPRLDCDGRAPVYDPGAGGRSRMRMPTVDHDERRRRIAEVTIEVIAREGLEAATIRRIAAELNGPTKLVTHYFVDKRELLLWAYQTLAQQHDRHATAAMAQDPTDILGALLAMTPVDEARSKHWRVYLAFWDCAARDPSIAELQRQQIELALRRLAGIIRARSGERPDLESVCERLNAVVQGLAIQALMDPQRWSAERLRARLAEEVAVVLGPAAAAPAAAASALA
jgi:AcrR family transcriptional regulator